MATTQLVSLLATLGGWRPSLEHFSTFLPEILWVGLLCVIVVAPLIAGRGPRVTATLVLLGLAVIGYCTGHVGHDLAGGGQSGLSEDAGSGMLIADSLTVFFKFLLLVFLAGIIALWWMGPGRTERDAPEFFVLLLGSALGMIFMVGTLNLLMIVVAIEFASLPSYAIVGFDKRNRKSAEASLKYMVFGSICAALMLYGISLLYGRFGTLNFAEISRGVVHGFLNGADLLVIGLGLFCFFCGLAFKISAVPFHFWCPDAFEGARTEVTTWLSVASKAAGLLLLLRLVYTFSSAMGTDVPMELPLGPLAWVIGLLAIVTCTVANFAAYWQTSVKRLLAYSSIAHAGYMLMAAAIFVQPLPDAAFPAIGAVLAYVLVYMFMNLGAFGVTALLSWQSGGDDSLNAFSGLIRRAPALAVPMLFCLISLVGLPPFAGFVVKWNLLSALADSGGTLGWVLVFAAVINTLISLWFYMRVVVYMMLKDDGRPAVHAPAGGVLLVNVCAVLLVVLLVFNQPLKTRTDALARNLWLPEPAAVTAPTVTAGTDGISAPTVAAAPGVVAVSAAGQ